MEFSKLNFFLIVYQIIWLFISPLVLGYLYWRGRKAPAYRQRLRERFGLGLVPKPVDIWIHAVSLGEVNAASSMVNDCLEKGLKVLVTCMTPTGSQQIQNLWGQRVFHQYCPYDVWFATQRFLKAYSPRLLVIFETELWPGILASCHRRHIPVILANARISNRSFGRYKKTKWIWTRLLNYFEKILVQSQNDYDRFLQLGAQPLQLEISGNLKFKQMPVSSVRIEFWQQFKKDLGSRKWLIAGSTHANEEQQLLEIWAELKQCFPDLLLCLVPRHPERFDEVFALAAAYQAQRFSNFDKHKPCEVLILDTIGELSSLYSIADIAFVGGSLVPIGGHNVLEPLFYGVPVLTGPFTFNQKDLVRILTEQKALVQVEKAFDLKEALESLLTDKTYCHQLVANGLETLKMYQGTLDSSMQAVLKSLDFVSL